MMIQSILLVMGIVFAWIALFLIIKMFNKKK